MLKILTTVLFAIGIASPVSAANYYAAETHIVGPGATKTPFFVGYGMFNLGVRCQIDFAAGLHDPVQFWMQNSVHPLVPLTARPLQSVDLSLATGGFQVSAPVAAIEVSCQGEWAQ